MGYFEKVEESLKMLLIALMLSVAIPSVLFAQKKVEGQVALTTNGRGVFLNFGGPGVKFFQGLLGINLMPTLRFQREEPKSFVTPLLGFGPQLFLLKEKKMILSIPFYYNASNNKWTMSAGLGYILTTKS